MFVSIFICLTESVCVSLCVWMYMSCVFICLFLLLWVSDKFSIVHILDSLEGEESYSFER